MQATVSSKVYGLILSNPGITLYEINRALGHTGVQCRAASAAVQNLMKRGAVKGKAAGARKTKYYKGTAPAVLRQAAGKTQKQLDKEIEVANIIAAIEAGVEVMIKQIKRKLEA